MSLRNSRKKLVADRQKKESKRYFYRNENIRRQDVVFALNRTYPQLENITLCQYSSQLIEGR